MTELKATYNNGVVYGLADSSNVYIDAVSLKEVLNCSIYSKLIKSDRLWVSADDLAVILEDNNCPTDDFEKWLISIRNIKVYYTYEEQEEPVLSSAELRALQMKWPGLAILRWAPAWMTGAVLWVKPRFTN